MQPTSPPASTENARFDLPGRGTQALIGLTLAGLIAGSWIGIHIFGLFVFELTWASLPFAIGLAIVQCWLSVGVFIVCHDAMHGTLVPGKRPLNAAIGAVLLFLYAGFRWQVLRRAHYAHHELAGHVGDPDFDENNPSSFGAWYWTFFKRYFGWQSLIFVNTVVAVYWVILGVPMVQLVLLYGAPALLSSLQLFYFGTYRPHRHVVRDGVNVMPFADHNNARSDDFGTLLSLLTCFHFGYHLEHHHRPDVPWWALPSARRAGIAASKTQDSPLQSTKEIAA